jgi:hypothetical protein
VVSIKIRDNGGEFRIEIVGSFAGGVVDDVQFAWHSAMGESMPRRIVVDITELSGYDFAGGSLLRDMYRYGTQIAAASPQSLVFLNEISGSARRGPALVRKTPQNAVDDEKVMSIRRTRVGL